MIIGEIYPDKVVTQADVAAYYAPNFVPFNMMLVGFFGGGWGKKMPTCATAAVPPFRDAAELTRQLQEYYAGLPPGAQPNFVLGNHDVPRLAERVGAGFARAAAVILLTLRGTPTMCVVTKTGLAGWGWYLAGKRNTDRPLTW